MPANGHVCRLLPPMYPFLQLLTAPVNTLVQLCSHRYSYTLGCVCFYLSSCTCLRGQLQGSDTKGLSVWGTEPLPMPVQLPRIQQKQKQSTAYLVLPMSLGLGSPVGLGIGQEPRHFLCFSSADGCCCSCKVGLEQRLLGKQLCAIAVFMCTPLDWV